jgi:hypothetical protein
MFTNRTSLVLYLWMFATAILAYIFGGLIHSKWATMLLIIASAIAYMIWLFWHWRERPHREAVLTGIIRLRDRGGIAAGAYILAALLWQVFTLGMAIIVLRGLPGEPCFCSESQGTHLLFVLPWVSLGLFYTEYQVWL